MPLQSYAFRGRKDSIDTITLRNGKNSIQEEKVKRFFFLYVCYSDADNEIMHVNIPISKPSGYNATVNPVTIKLNLDPNCRYQIA